MTGFTDWTTTDEARERLLDLVAPVEETERIDVSAGDDRVLAEAVDAPRAVPHYERAAMDGFAVRAGDTTEASERAPVRMDVGEAADDGRAVPVNTGEEVPPGADAVVPVERTERVDDVLTVFAAVPPGENVAPVGEDVPEGERIFEAGHRLGPADLGLLRSVGVETVPVYRRPDVALVPTGEELVQRDPGPGEVVDTNALTVGRYVERWGGAAEKRDPVTDDSEAIQAAVKGALSADVVVTLGGTSVGERDLVPDAVAALGEMVVHGVALRPGHPVGFGVVEETPVVTLPGYPVGCLVAANALLRPAVARAARRSRTAADPPTTAATLDGRIASEVGARTFARVSLDGETASPIRAKGSGVLSSVTEADGWVVVPDSREGYDAGETVAVEQWEGWP